jgi:hypothetical protein
MISICFIVFLLISILTSSYGQVTCASGWIQNGGSCYLIRPIFSGGLDYGTWDQCNAYCPTSYPGATMLCVNNADENTWIRSKYPDWYWIGYTDMLPYGGGKGTMRYRWVTGCSSTYTNWVVTQPDNNGNNEDYVGVHPYGQWQDYSPQSQFYCGCEYNPSTVPTAAPSTVAPSKGPTASPSSNSTSSPTAIPTFSSSDGDISE